MSQHRLQVAATILFHSTCAIAVTLVSKTALNGINAPVTLLALQTVVQVLMLTAVGVPMGWVTLRKAPSVSSPPFA
jgi:GDP-fucose transporter C1